MQQHTFIAASVLFGAMTLSGQAAAGPVDLLFRPIGVIANVVAGTVAVVTNAIVQPGAVPYAPPAPAAPAYYGQPPAYYGQPPVSYGPPPDSYYAPPPSAYYPPPAPAYYAAPPAAYYAPAPVSYYAPRPGVMYAPRAAYVAGGVRYYRDRRGYR